MSLLISGDLRLAKNSVAPQLIDAYPGATSAYSLRNLSWTYGGPVVRVRRSSDNTEQDFTATQVTDGTLTTFCGAGNGFVRTWYDQSGNGNNAQQATTSLQPSIVSSGSLVTESGKPAINFNTSFLERTANSFLFSVFACTVVKSSGAGITAYLGGGAFQLAFGQQQSGTFDPVNSFWAWAPSQASTYGLLDSWNANRNLHTYWIPDATESNWRWYLNGQISGAPGLTTGAPIGSALNFIGTNGADPPWIGPIQEIVLYPVDQTSNRVAIESNINAHYAIY
jgi:hypothetical protein